jgi:high frequency lysogenization protein
MSPEQAARAQALALAAVLESAILVDQLAREGSAPAPEMQAMADSLFRTEWDSVEEVFGGIDRLRRGLALLEGLLSRYPGDAQGNTLRYTLAMLHLGRLLARDRERLGVIRSRLAHSALQSSHFATRFDDLASSIAAIYQDTISTYRYRIQVAGNATHLQDSRVADRIRSMLLAGLRATILWRHVGGSRIGLLLGRARLLHAVRAVQRGD